MPTRNNAHRELLKITPFGIRPTGPIARIHTFFHVPMNGRIRPIDRTPDMPMLDGVEMDVIEMPFEIDVIPDEVFPKAPLPDRRFAMLACGCATSVGIERHIA